jgi:type VI secretion system secreted protein Hcp
MAQTIHLKLQIDGNDIVGESTVASLDRADTIECSTFEDSLEIPFEAATGRSTTRRRYTPIRICKRIDQTTPLLFKALCRNEPVNRAEFRFFRPNIDGSGAEQHFLTIVLGQDTRITKISRFSKDNLMAGENSPPMMEYVEFTFSDITVTYEDGGVEHQDVWRQGAE